MYKFQIWTLKHQISGKENVIFFVNIRKKRKYIRMNQITKKNFLKISAHQEKLKKWGKHQNRKHASLKNDQI